MRVDRVGTVVLGLGLAVAGLEACAHHVVNYELGENERMGRKLAWMVGVEKPAFKESLIAEMREKGVHYSCNERDSYDGDIADQIGRQMARHLAYSGMFARVAYLPDLPGVKVDHRMRVTVTRFRGCKEIRDAPEPGKGAGSKPVSASGQNEADHGAGWKGFGEVVFEPVVVIDSLTDVVAWQGTAKGEHREDALAVMVSSAVDQADNAMKAAVSSLAVQIAENPHPPGH